MGWAWVALCLAAVALAIWGAFRVVGMAVWLDGRYRLLGLVASLLAGAFCVRLGMFLAYVGWTETRGMDVQHVTFPALGWVVISAGGLAALIAAFRSLSAASPREELEGDEGIAEECIDGVRSAPSESSQSA